MRPDAEKADGRGPFASRSSRARSGPSPTRIRVAPGIAFSAAMARSWPLRGSSAPAVDQQWSGDAERGLGGRAVHGPEGVEIDARMVHADLLRRHAQRGHVVADRAGDGEQSAGRAAGRHDLRADVRPGAPEMHVAAPRLDREGDAQRLREQGGGGPVGPEELRVDHVERKVPPDLRKHRQQRVRHAPRRPGGADLRPDPVARPVDMQPVPDLGWRQGPERGVMRMQRQRPGGQPDRRHHPHLDPGLRGERPRLPLDEHAQRRPVAVGEQGRQSQHAQHRPGPSRKRWEDG